MCGVEDPPLGHAKSCLGQSLRAAARASRYACRVERHDVQRVEALAVGGAAERLDVGGGGGCGGVGVGGYLAEDRTQARAGRGVLPILVDDAVGDNGGKAEG